MTLCETAWALQRCYAVRKPQLREIPGAFLSTRQLLVENTEIAWKALRIYEAGNAGFSDALMDRENIGDGCEYTVTFDRRAARSPGFESPG